MLLEEVDDWLDVLVLVLVGVFRPSYLVEGEQVLGLFVGVLVWDLVVEPLAVVALARVEIGVLVADLSG